MAKREDKGTAERLSIPGAQKMALASKTTSSLSSTRFPSVSLLYLQMDPLSITASVVALLGFASQLVKGGYAIGQSVREFRKEILIITDEVALLVGVLHSLLPSISEVSDASADTFLVFAAKANEPRNAARSSSVTELSKPSPPSSDSEYENIQLHNVEDRLSSQLVKEIGLCRKTLVEVESLLSQTTLKAGKRVANAAKQIQWVFKKSEVQQLRQTLERHKTAFGLILSAQGT